MCCGCKRGRHLTESSFPTPSPPLKSCTCFTSFLYRCHEKEEEEGCIRTYMRKARARLHTITPLCSKREFAKLQTPFFEAKKGMFRKRKPPFYLILFSYCCFCSATGDKIEEVTTACKTKHVVHHHPNP